jgi:hypothetical protein
MKLFQIQRKPGFRLNILDLLFIGGLGGTAYVLHQLQPELSLWGIPLYLGVSFFGFCNVFRIGNRLEPFWYLPFSVIAAYCLSIWDLALFWKLVIYILEPLKWGLIIYHMSCRPYYGLGYHWVNRMKRVELDEENGA